MRHAATIVLVALLSVVTGAACAIKNQKGEEVLRVKVGVETGDSAKSKSPDDAENNEAQAAETTEVPPETTRSDTAEPAAPTTDTGEDSATTDQPTGDVAAAVPWWKRSGVKERDLTGGAAETTTPDSETGNGSTDDFAVIPPGSITSQTIDDENTDSAVKDEPAATDDPQTDAGFQPPAKRVVQIDRHLQPIPHDLWVTAYDRNSTKSAKADRRASISNVQKAIDAGYGAAYVSQLEKAITLDRTNGYAYYFLARGRFDKGDWKGAKGFADKAVELLAEDPTFRSSARVLYAKVLANLGEQSAASTQANEALTDNPENTEARILSLRLQ